VHVLVFTEDFKYGRPPLALSSRLPHSYVSRNLASIPLYQSSTLPQLPSKLSSFKSAPHLLLPLNKSSDQACVDFATLSSRGLTNLARTSGPVLIPIPGTAVVRGHFHRDVYPHPYEPPRSGRTSAMGVTRTIRVAGSGPQPAKGQKVTIAYTGWLKDTSQPENKGQESVPFSTRHARQF